MKIRLIEPEPPGAHVWAKTRIPRLGLPIIAAALTAQGHDVLIYSPPLAPIDWDDVDSSELVGLSTTTSTAVAAYEIADRLRIPIGTVKSRHHAALRFLRRRIQPVEGGPV